MSGLTLSAAEKYNCDLSILNGPAGSSGQAMQAVLYVARVQSSSFPPAPTGGRYRIWEGTRILAEGDFQINYEGRFQQIPIGRPSNGFHIIRAEYFDPAGRFARCDSDNAVFYMGSGNPPLSLLDPANGEVYYGERHSLVMMAAPEIAAWNANTYMRGIHASTGEVLFYSFPKEFLWANGQVPLTPAQELQGLNVAVRLDLYNQLSGFVYYRDPSIYRMNFIPRTRLKVSTVTNRTDFQDTESFELQANFTTSKGTETPLYGRLDWYDGPVKIAEERFNGEAHTREPFFLRRTGERGGEHAYRAEYVAATPSSMNPYPVPSGTSQVFVVNIAAPTELTLSGEGLSGATENTVLRLRAELRSRGVLVPTGQIEFALNGASVGRAPLVNGVATWELRNLPAGAYRAEARFASSGGLLASRGEISFAVSAGLSVRHAASGSSALAVGGLSSLYGTGLSTVTAVNASAVPGTNLGGVSLQILDSASRLAAAPLLYVSPGQINFLVPEGLAPGVATLTLQSPGRGPVQTRVELRSVAPGFFTMNGLRIPAGVMVLRDADGQVTQQDLFDCASGICRERVLRLPANIVEAVLVLYGSGWRNSSTPVVARANGANAELLYAGSQGQFAGLDQINLRWRSEWRGRISIVLDGAGILSNPVEVIVE